MRLKMMCGTSVALSLALAADRSPAEWNADPATASAEPEPGVELQPASSLSRPSSGMSPGTDLTLLAVSALAALALATRHTVRSLRQE